MKKALKIFSVLIALTGVPALASAAIVALWNGIIAHVCGFATIGFWQGVGIFLLGQLASGGFLIMLFMLFGSLHAIRHHHADLGNHWHNMSDEERREFIRRRRSHFGFRNRSAFNEDNAAEG